MLSTSTGLLFLFLLGTFTFVILRILPTSSWCFFIDMKKKSFDSTVHKSYSRILHAKYVKNVSLFL